MIKEFLRPTKVKLLLTLLWIVLVPASIMLFGEVFAAALHGGGRGIDVISVLLPIVAVPAALFLYVLGFLVQIGLPLPIIIVLAAVCAYLFSCLVALIYTKIRKHPAQK